MRRTSISTAGTASRSFIIGSSECPPAISLASSPCSASSAIACVDGVGADVVERGRDHADTSRDARSTARTMLW